MVPRIFLRIAFLSRFPVLVILELSLQLSFTFSLCLSCLGSFCHGVICDTGYHTGDHDKTGGNTAPDGIRSRGTTYWLRKDIEDPYSRAV